MKKSKGKSKKLKRREKPSLYVLEEKSVFLSEQRTILSKERTILSFMQTGLAFIGSGIVIVKFMDTPAFNIIGWMLILIGFVEIAESYKRLILYKRKMEGLKAKMKKINQ